MTQEELREAHDHCRGHKEEIGQSSLCGCFYCKKTFKPDTILIWIDKRGETALCPLCGIDSVIGSASGYDLTPQFLKEMSDHWFGIPR
jgi:hypothetical protein